MASVSACIRCGASVAEGVPDPVCERCLAAELLSSENDVGRTQTLGDRPASPTDVAAGLGRFGDYELLEELARGGMGVVFKARHVTLNRTVALKMILSGRFAGAAEVRRFRNEAEAAARLDHPNIVPIYEVGEHKGLSYYTMRLVEGGSLSSRMSEFALPLPPKKPTKALSYVSGRADVRQRQRVVASVMAAVAKAVHYAHERGVLHRDLKPANILIDLEGVPHVTDLGIAKKLGEDSGMTHTGAVVGTPAYMSPEQAAGKTLTIAADVYGLGAILYELLCGRPPFADENVMSLLKRIADEEPKQPRTINGLVDRDLSTICFKCLGREPNSRYRSAQALADDLDRWLRGEPIAARTVSTRERAVKWVRRHPATTAFLMAIMVVTVGGFAAVTWQWRRAESALDSSEWNQYTARVALAMQEWDARNVSTGDEHLERCRADLRGWEWHYLKRLCHPHLLRVMGHESEATTFAFSPDGLTVATAGMDGKVILWDVIDGGEKARLEHGQAVYAVAFSPDGSRLAATVARPDDNESWTGEVVVWDVRTHTRLKSRAATRLPAPNDGNRVVRGRVGQLRFSPDGRYLLVLQQAEAEALSESAPQLNVRDVVWDVVAGKDILSVPHKGDVVFSIDSKYLRTDAGVHLLAGSPLGPRPLADVPDFRAQDEREVTNYERADRDRLADSVGSFDLDRIVGVGKYSPDGRSYSYGDALIVRSKHAPELAVQPEREPPIELNLHRIEFSRDELRLASFGELALSSESRVGPAPFWTSGTAASAATSGRFRETTFHPPTSCSVQADGMSPRSPARFTGPNHDHPSPTHAVPAGRECGTFWAGRPCCRSEATMILH